MSGKAELVPDEIVITVTWMDGEVQVYRYFRVSSDSKHRLENGVLTIDGFSGSAGTLHLPLANIRQIAVEGIPGGLRRS